ncbi:hypothetical protein D9M68_936390 [compost metagenome]
MQAGAALHVLAHLLHGQADTPVADGFGGHLQGFEQGHATATENRQAARQARALQHLQQAANTRQTQQQLVATQAPVRFAQQPAAQPPEQQRPP